MKIIRYSIESLLFIFVATSITLFIMVQNNSRAKKTIRTQASLAQITPLPTSSPPSPQETTMDSPDGSETLSLVKKVNSGSIEYSLFVSSSPEQKKLIFNKNIYPSASLEIPFNTWSPDNSYVFIKEKTPSNDNYLVFKSSGDLFANGSPYVSIQELFKEKIPNYLITDVTGWADNTLLVVNTEGLETNSKLSFWFDVPSQSFMQLATYFK